MTKKLSVQNDKGKGVDNQPTPEPKWRMYQLAAPDTPEPAMQYVGYGQFCDVRGANDLAQAVHASIVTIIANVRVAVSDGEEVVEWRARGSGWDDWRRLDLESECPVEEIHAELCLNRNGDPHNPQLEWEIESVWPDVVDWIREHHRHAPIHVAEWCWILPVPYFFGQIWYAQPHHTHRLNDAGEYVGEAEILPEDLSEQHATLD